MPPDISPRQAVVAIVAFSAMVIVCGLLAIAIMELGLYLP